ncbi:MULTISPECIES: hypothetical protein [unclassified Frondihabitans]|uniref:hypothetical protein n=1 Tax=unclassified Frondihabitans TaxID=2626248 RepID=UPI000F4F8BD8|nr:MULTISPECIES: hypothetical protein [unclassified Frondihabitans]RPE76058.1 hypothetical protein EDF37_1876 [Frondihabitans sp. PhB153]RPF05666.1 hypothetical protein EDF39_2373 [Frondihabitans sp. PhB161]
MRIAAFILTIVLATGILMGGVVLLVLQGNSENPAWIFAQTLAMIPFVYGPLTIGSFRAYWDVAGSEESRRYFRRVVSIVIGLEGVAAVITVVCAVATSSAPLIPIVFIGTGAILTAVALLVGPVAYRYDRAHPRPQQEWVAIEPTEIRRKIVTVAVTFVGVLALGLVGLGVLSAVVPRSLSLLQVLIFALSFACIAGGGVALFSTLPWNRRLRDVTDRDPARLRRIAKVVVRKKPGELDPQDMTAAARYAAVISITMSFQLAYLVLLYAGIVLQQVNTLQEGIGDSFSIILIVILVAVLVVILPLQVVRIRRARRYVTEHAAGLNESAVV